MPDESVQTPATAGGGNEATETMEVISLPIDKLRPAPWNARRHFDDAALDDLGKSLQELGQLSPIIVRASGDVYEIVAGERRYRAAKRIGMTHLHAIISDNEDHTVVRKGLAENLDREDLNAWDHMQGVLSFIALELDRISSRWPDLVEEHGDELRAAGHIVGLCARWYPHAAPAALEELDLMDAEPLLDVLDSVFDRKVQDMTIQSFRVQRLRLLRLPDDLIEILQRGLIDVSKVLQLDRVKDEDERKRLTKEVLANDWTHEEVVKRVSASLSGVPTNTTDNEPDLWSQVRRWRSVLKKVDQLPKAEQRKVERLVAQVTKLLFPVEDAAKADA